MKGFRILFLFSLLFSNGYAIYNNRNYRKFSIGYRRMKKNSKQLFSTVTESSLENFTYILKDDLSNDLLYLLKVYNFTNDEINSYFYIILYETLSLLIKNDKYNRIDINIYIFNIITYLLIKNLIFTKILHHII